MAILLKAIYKFNAIPIKIPMSFLKEIEQKIIDLYVTTHTHTKQKPHIDKAILRKENEARGIILPDFNLSHRAVIIKIAWYWQKNRHTDQWNRTENPVMKPHGYGQVIFDKGVRNTQWRRENLFNKW